MNPADFYRLRVTSSFAFSWVELVEVLPGSRSDLPPRVLRRFKFYTVNPLSREAATRKASEAMAAAAVKARALLAGEPGTCPICGKPRRSRGYLVQDWPRFVCGQCVGRRLGLRPT